MSARRGIVEWREKYEGKEGRIVKAVDGKERSV